MAGAAGLIATRPAAGRFSDERLAAARNTGETAYGCDSH